MIDPFFDFAQTANYFAPHPQWGSVPARGALGLGGLLARVGAPLFGPHHERHDHFPRWLSGDSLRTFLPRLSNPTGKATDPWASSRSASSASLATSSAGPYGRPLFPRFVPRAGDRTAVKPRRGRDRRHDAFADFAFREQPRWLQPRHADERDTECTPQWTESFERERFNAEPSGKEEQATREWMVRTCARSCAHGESPRCGAARGTAGVGHGRHWNTFRSVRCHRLRRRQLCRGNCWLHNPRAARLLECERWRQSDAVKRRFYLGHHQPSGHRYCGWLLRLSDRARSAWRRRQ